MDTFLTFGLQFLRVALALMFAAWAFGEYNQGQSVGKWPTVEGTITSASIKQVTTKFGNRDEADIHYEYSVNGKKFTSDRIQFGGVAFRSPSDTVKEYKGKKQLLVHYKPGDPAVSSLEPGFNIYSVMMGFVGTFFFAFLAFTDADKGSSITSYVNSSQPMKKRPFGNEASANPLRNGIKTRDANSSGTKKSSSLPIPYILAMIAVAFGVKTACEYIHFDKTVSSTQQEIILKDTQWFLPVHLHCGDDAKSLKACSTKPDQIWKNLSEFANS